MTHTDRLLRLFDAMQHVKREAIPAMLFGPQPENLIAFTHRCLRPPYRPVLSNTPPTIPYRSAGRPDAMFVIERLIDMAADLHGFDLIELRRRNLPRLARVRLVP